MSQILLTQALRHLPPWLIFDVRQKKTMQKGYLYVLANSHMGGLVKIGRTDRSPSERVSELSSATGVPTPFILVWHEEVANSESAEREVHAILGRYRVSLGREFFQMEVKDAIQAVCGIAAKYAVISDAPVSPEQVEAQWEKDDELLVGAIQLARNIRRAFDELPLERRKREWPGGIEPRLLRMELKINFEQSRTLFQKLQELGVIDSKGKILIT